MLGLTLGKMGAVLFRAYRRISQGYILLESGSVLLDEAGNKLILE